MQALTVRSCLWSLPALALLATACVCPGASAQPKGRVREPAAAGSFYPTDPAALEAQVRGFLAKSRKQAEAPVRMVLVPHAGLQYSGQVAAEAFAQVAPGFGRVVLIAGNHSNAVDYAGVSVDRATAYRVPGLEVKVAPAAGQLLARPGFVDVPGAHGMHMLEIELPFLRAVNGKPFEIVPLTVGSLTAKQAKAAAAELARLAEPGTLFVISVDLSHYFPYAEAVALDRPCLAAAVRSDVQAVSSCNTDATQVLLMMTELAALQGWTPRLLAYANSGDTSGDRSRVVGYGAIAYEDRFVLSPEEGAELVKVARRALEERVRNGRGLSAPPEVLARWPRLALPRGAFVTLNHAGALRGCIGNLTAEGSLLQAVCDNAGHAAVADPRFPPVRPEELAGLDVSVSVLDAPRALEKLKPEALLARLGSSRPGVILDVGSRRSTYLPEVWEQLPKPAEFLEELCAKQGSPRDCWRDPSAKLQTYGSQHFSEKPAR